MTDDIAPGYSRKIKHPMDLRTIKEKIQRGEYASLSNMHQDVLLMFRNCKVFNKEGEIVQVGVAEHTVLPPSAVNNPLQNDEVTPALVLHDPYALWFMYSFIVCTVCCRSPIS